MNLLISLVICGDGLLQGEHPFMSFFAIRAVVGYDFAIYRG
jgi:hypothetical protein